MNKYRTHMIKDINESLVDKKVVVSGWIENIRDHGGVLFLDLRDESVTLQTVSNDDDMFKGLAKESVIKLTGVIRKRAEGTENERIATVYFELLVDSLEMLGESVHELPFEIMTSKSTKDDVRLKYRYLDMRNEQVKKNMILRSDILHFLRNKMYDLGFNEVQTPILTASSPEGARDFVVPSRLFKGKFYALPQAPQIYKELLMVGGMGKYFQIAPCFRDEDARADRSPGEFYQLDMEMAFAGQEDVFEVMEKVIYNTFTKFSTKRVGEYPFPRIPYNEAMLKYGTDKPDLRNPLIIQDVTNIFEKLDIKVFNGKIVRTITLPKGASATRNFYDDMTSFAINECHAKGLAWLKVGEDRSLQGPIAKLIDDESREALLTQTGTEAGDSIFFIAEHKGIVEKLAGQIREEIAIRQDLLEKDVFRFCWIVDFPMFEIADNGKLEFCHNPFSMPQGGMEALETKDPLDVYAYQYDIVCNGIELSSGAVRNHDPEIMIKAFEIAGYTEEEIMNRFSALFKAFHYGAPPHAGIAPGVDRMLMLLTEEDSIREVVAFPMNSKAQDLLMGAPGIVSEKQLREANIKIDKKLN